MPRELFPPPLTKAAVIGDRRTSHLRCRGVAQLFQPRDGKDERAILARHPPRGIACERVAIGGIDRRVDRADIALFNDRSGFCVLIPKTPAGPVSDSFKVLSSPLDGLT